MKNSFFPLAALFSICSANAQITPRTDPKAANLPVAKNLPAVLYSPPSVTIVNEPGQPPYNQTWMQKNLNVTKYRNGDPIPQVADSAAWAVLTTGAWCWYNNDPRYGTMYGKLYNWYAVTDARGLAPEGWHIPGDKEWKAMSDALGGDEVAGGKMKTPGTRIYPDDGKWFGPNFGATNSSGFSGLPGGYRDNYGSFYGAIVGGLWWSSSEIWSSPKVDVKESWCRSLIFDKGTITRDFKVKQCGFSVRCIKD